MEKGMTGIVKTVARLISGVVFVFGIYLVTHGHLTPGGGFAGGTVIAGSFILLVLAFGDDMMHLRRVKEGSSALENMAILAFLLAGVLGMVLGSKVFFANFLARGVVGELVSAGIIPVFNLLIGLEVAAALFTVFLAFVIFKEEEK
ncbi:MAG: MnhB domain-containing protein [Bacteroidales bacterium]